MHLKHPPFAAFPALLVAVFVFAGCSSSRAILSAEKQLLKDPVIKAAHIGISIYDAGTEKYVHNHQGDRYFVPASNTKIPTCYAAMKYLGDSLTALYYNIPAPGSVMIAGTGSPDLLHPDYPAQPVMEFLRPFNNIVLSVKTGEEFLGSGWSWSDYLDDYMAPHNQLPLYGNTAQFGWKAADSVEIMPSFFEGRSRVRDDLTEGFSVSRPWGENSFLLTAGTVKQTAVPFVPDSGTIRSLLQDTLHTPVTLTDTPLSPGFRRLYSRPVDSVLSPMMHRSDNFFAEQMLLMVSQERLGIMSDPKIIDTLLKTDLAGLPQKPRWVDGSGLSRYNLFTPQDFVYILARMKQEFGMERIKTILATGGEGTIRSYYKADSSYLFAKTGTLSGVVCLSGYFYTRKGKLMIFSVLVNNHTGSATPVRRAVERFIQRVRQKN